MAEPKKTSDYELKNALVMPKQAFEQLTHPIPKPLGSLTEAIKDLIDSIKQGAKDPLNRPIQFTIPQSELDICKGKFGLKEGEYEPTGKQIFGEPEWLITVKTNA